MKEEKIIRYFPRSHFWKVWEKRKIEVILTETDEKITSQNFRKDGTLERDYLHWANGDQIEKIYFPSGQLSEETDVCGCMVRCVRWDMNGHILDDVILDQKAAIETHYYPDGKLKMHHDRKTGEYEEWSQNGLLKKRGHWLRREDGRIAGLKDIFAGFETGNMRIKREDERRQEYNEAIDAINILPATQGRKIAKETLAKEYKKSLAKLRE